MFYHIFSSTWKDLKVMAQDRRGLVLLFAMPIMFIFVMSLALAGLFTDGDNPVTVMLVNEDVGSIGASLASALETSGAFNVETEWNGAPLTRVQAEELIVAQKRNIALVIPAGFTEAVQRAASDTSAGQEPAPVLLDLVVDPAVSSQVLGPIQGVVNGLSQQVASQAVLPHNMDLMFQQLGRSGTPVPVIMQDQLKQQATQHNSGQDPLVTVKQTQPAGMKIEKLPNIVQQNVPAWTLFAVFTISQQVAGSILEEKKVGTFRRLLVAPMSRAAILLGKLTPYLIVNVIQIALMFAVGVFILPLTGAPRLALGAHPEGLLLVSLAASLVATGLGLMIAALAKTSESVGSLGSLLVITLAALGGVMVPRFVMPQFMQTLGLISPHAWALIAYQDVLVRGYDVARILPELGVLMGFATAFFGVALWRFRWD